MQQFCQYGSVRGATGNRRPYRDNSYTLERSIKLSARLRDSAGLEAFMLREFFDAPPRRQPGITS